MIPRPIHKAREKLVLAFLTCGGGFSLFFVTQVYPPIAPLEDIENELANGVPLSDDSANVLAADVRVVTEGSSSSEDEEISGKDLDLYRVQPARSFYNAPRDLGGENRGARDMGRSGGGRGGRSQDPMSHRSSYLFCSEAHGMMR